MLKLSPEVKIEREAVGQIKNLLGGVPFIKIEGVDREPSEPDHNRGQADFLLRLKAHGRSCRLVCEVKGSGQPRYVRAAIAQLHSYINRSQRDVYAVVIAPYLSLAAQQICREEKVGFLDFEGNCRLVFNGVFIERLVPPKPSTERRELKSIFAPKSAQVLRVLMRDPIRPWKIAELAKSAGVSLGHASNVRSGLIDREWAGIGPEGLFLTNPDALLDGWREAYDHSPGKRLAFYTTLHGSSLQEETRGALEAANRDGAAMLGSFSAAQWISPYARTGTHYFYANEQGLPALRDRLRLSSAAKGENVIVMQLDDDGLFRDAMEPAPGIRCTSPVQTYLDLSIAGERGREAAEHLRAEKLKWKR
jgi:Transcriptional regulator, AbiEi antitoxin, Type IV TA system